MKDILIKAYGWIELESSSENLKKLQATLEELHKICSDWYLQEEIFELEENILQIHHEGEYFPEDEVATCLATLIDDSSKGKLDIIDLEAWTLKRFFLDAEHNSRLFEERALQSTEASHMPYSRKSGLDHALEASQEKNQKYLH